MKIEIVCFKTDEVVKTIDCTGQSKLSIDRMEKGKHTPTPWEWQLFGKEYYLTSQTKWRPIILGKNMITFLNPHSGDASISKAIEVAEKLIKESEAVQ